MPIPEEGENKFDGEGKLYADEQKSPSLEFARSNSNLADDNKKFASPT